MAKKEPDTRPLWQKIFLSWWFTVITFIIIFSIYYWGPLLNFLMQTKSLEIGKHGVSSIITMKENQYAVQNHLDKLPENVLNYLVSSNVVITELRENDEIKDKTIKGVVDNNEIRLQSNKVLISVSLLHEIGHFIDEKKSISKSSSEFDTIFETEKDYMQVKTVYPIDSTIYKSYVSKSKSEYFTNAFYLYVLYPDILKKSAPRTYNYMNNFLENLN